MLIASCSGILYTYTCWLQVVLAFCILTLVDCKLLWHPSAGQRCGCCSMTTSRSVITWVWLLLSASLCAGEWSPGYTCNSNCHWCIHVDLVSGMMECSHVGVNTWVSKECHFKIPLGQRVQWVLTSFSARWCWQESVALLCKLFLV